MEFVHEVTAYLENKPGRLAKICSALGTEFTTAEVLAVTMDNRPGALARILERLAEEHINVEYAYASSAPSPGKALGIFQTSNAKRAKEVLSEPAFNGLDRSGGRRPLHSR